MGVIQNIFITCDRCHDEQISSERNATEARREVRAWGWKRRSGQDLCPRCAASTAAEEG